MGLGAAKVIINEIDRSFAVDSEVNLPMAALVFFYGEWGPVNSVEYVKSSKQFVDKFGIPISPVEDSLGDNYLSWVHAMQVSGKIPTYAIRVADTSTPGNKASSTVNLLIDPSTPSDSDLFTVTAKYYGKYGNRLVVSLEKSKSLYYLTVYEIKNDDVDISSGVDDKLTIIEQFAFTDSDFTETKIESIDSEYIDINILDLTNLKTILSKDSKDHRLFVNVGTDKLYFYNIEDFAEDNEASGTANHLSVNSHVAGSTNSISSMSSTLSTVIADNELANTEKYKFNFILSNGLGKFDDLGTTWNSGEMMKIILGLAYSRKDCIAIGETDDKDSVNELVDSVSSVPRDVRGSYGIVYGPWTISVDPISGKDMHIAPSYAMFDHYVSTQVSGQVWLVPAGLSRGKALGTPTFSLLYDQQETLLENQINPIINEPEGIYANGYLTLYASTSALNRIHARRLAILLEQKGYELTQQFLFEYATPAVISSLRLVLEKVFINIANQGGLLGYKIQIDDSLLETNGMVTVNLSFKPPRAIDFIELTFTVKTQL